MELHELIRALNIIKQRHSAPGNTWFTLESDGVKEIDYKVPLGLAKAWLAQLELHCGDALTVNISASIESLDKATEIDALRAMMPVVSHITRNDKPLCGAATWVPEFTWEIADITASTIGIITCEDCVAAWEKRQARKPKKKGGKK